MTAVFLKDWQPNNYCIHLLHYSSNEYGIGRHHTSFWSLEPYLHPIHFLLQVQKTRPTHVEIIQIEEKATR